MKILKECTTLFEIEKMLEREIMSSDNNIRIISDINLTYEEYEYIKFKFQGLGLYRSDVEVWNQYRLCTLVYWVFSLIYEEKDSSHQAISNLFDGMHQHATRYLVEIYNDTFEEFGIEIPGIVVNNVETLCESIAMHAGIPVELHTKFYVALDDALCDAESRVVEKDFLKQLSLSPKLKFIMKHVGKDLQKDMLSQYKKVVYDLKVEGLTKQEVLERNPVVSKRIISSFDKLYRHKEQDALAV